MSASSAPPHPPAEKMYDSCAHSGQASHSGQQSVRKACDSRSRPGQGKSSGKDPREKLCNSRAKTSAPVSSSSAGPSSSLPSILQGLAQAAAQTAISTRSQGTLCRAVFLFLCILNVVVIFYYIFYKCSTSMAFT